ncbi:hypothetical protein [Streptomyces sp. TP-A0874]|uniref:hypothetical protein n=1 Tax=Streptomyces sp. TP-A0874 TaxID=549819 RepID=UPI000853C7F1|nr:hypothetical protein [Streptomyces sp. TP-A0874]
MFWPMIALALAFTGTAVLGVLAVRVALEVRRLAGRLAEASVLVERAAEEFERSVAPLAADVRTAPGD